MGFYSPLMAGTVDFSDIQKLLSKGEAEAAYVRLISMQAKYEGELEYDLLMAQAALLTERTNIAQFVLERVLIIQPKHHQARLLMASAYARLGRPVLARAELLVVLAAKTAKPKVKKQAESMLKQLSAAETTNRMAAYVAMGFGYDGNANAATSSQTFDVFGITYDLTPQSTATRSMSAMLNLGMSWQHQLESKSLVFATLDWRANIFPQASFVNNDVARYQFGWQKPRHYSLVYQGGNVNVDAAYNNASNHLLGMWNIGKRGDSNIFLRVGELHYLASQNSKDVMQYQLGGTFSLEKWVKETNLATILAQDVAVLSTSPYGRDMIGLNMRTKLKTLNPFTVSIGAGVLYSEYRGLFFGLGRQERQSSLNVGLHTKRWTNWELSLDLAYTDTWSTVTLYDHERFTLGLKFKRNYVR